MSGERDHALFEAIKSADIAAIERLAVSGADTNMRDNYGEPALFAAVDSVHFADDAGERERCMTVVQRLADLGADINALDGDGANILVGPILGVNTDLVAFLLGLGVDPNHGCSGESYETVYDAAISDYAYEAWIAPMLPSLNESSEPTADEDCYLAWLEREAVARGYLRPDIPLLLRQHGAQTGNEMVACLGGMPGQSVRWTESGWTLAG